MASAAEVVLWGRRIGAVAIGDDERVASFEYDPAFTATRYELAPFAMPLSRQVYRFPELSAESFRGLPGMLADALPDRFGNALIDEWLARQGRTPDSFDAVERLCYTGTRAMGALEFRPPEGPVLDQSVPVEVAELTELAQRVLAERTGMRGRLTGDDERAQGLADILRVGTSAGGARAKAVIAWNRETGEFRSGQVDAGEGFEQWLLKFDGVADDQPDTLQTPQGYGAVEYAYSRLARAAGIDMPPTELLPEGDRRHFMVRRFDREAGGRKLHMQSLAALRQLDFNRPEGNTYEEALLTIRELGRLAPPGERLAAPDVEQQFRRMVFNVVGRNQDDHVKNIAFLMDREGRWRLSPAFDATWAFGGPWTSRHQMSINGKRDHFTVADLDACAATASLVAGRARAILGEVTDAVRRWPEEAAEAGVGEERIERIAATHRLALPAG